jgi:hypothetical protein
VQVTSSYADTTVVPDDIRTRYKWIETGNAAAILGATSPREFADLLTVLRDFQLHSDTWLVAGGNKGDIAAMLDQQFRDLGWKETRIDTEVKGHFFTDFVKRGRDYVPTAQTEVPSVYSEGFRVDNHKGRMIVDIEWNAKDGNLDRDLSAYRSWYEYGLINGAVIITKDRLPLLALARRVWNEYQQTLPAADRTPGLPIDLATSTTTSLDKAQIRVLRQGAGTCPVLIIGVSDITWDDSPFTGGS